jgi:hypothetical protein
MLPVTYGIPVGDGANDLDMISAAGLGIAFNANPAVCIAADTSPSLPHLDAIHLLGTSREDVRAARAEIPRCRATAASFASPKTSRRRTSPRPSETRSRQAHPCQQPGPTSRRRAR